MGKNERPQTPEEVLYETPSEQKTEDIGPTMLDILKNKYQSYVLVVDPDIEGPKTLVLKRWAYGVSVELLPMSLEIMSSVFSVISPMLKGADPIVGLSFAVNDEALLKAVGKHLGSIVKIIARTLVSSKENGFRVAELDKTCDYVRSLDTYDIIQLVKILFKQNFGHLGKNALGLTLETKEVPEVSEK